MKFYFIVLILSLVVPFSPTFDDKPTSPHSVAFVACDNSSDHGIFGQMVICLNRLSLNNDESRVPYVGTTSNIFSLLAKNVNNVAGFRWQTELRG